jgi:hypothetical protein
VTDLKERVARAIWERRRAFSMLEYGIELEPWGDGRIPEANGVIFEAMAAIEAVKQSDEMRQLNDAQTFISTPGFFASRDEDYSYGWPEIDA